VKNAQAQEFNLSPPRKGFLHRGEKFPLLQNHPQVELMVWTPRSFDRRSVAPDCLRDYGWQQKSPA
jgi:hypothetical protein